MTGWGVVRVDPGAGASRKNARFSKIESSKIVANADMRVGEIRQFCRLQDEGAALSRVEASEPDAGGDDATQPVGACLSLHAKREAGSHDCGPGGLDHGSEGSEEI